MYPGLLVNCNWMASFESLVTVAVYLFVVAAGLVNRATRVLCGVVGRCVPYRLQGPLVGASLPLIWLAFPPSRWLLPLQLPPRLHSLWLRGGLMRRYKSFWPDRLLMDWPGGGGFWQWQCGCAREFATTPTTRRSASISPVVIDGLHGWRASPRISSPNNCRRVYRWSLTRWLLTAGSRRWRSYPKWWNSSSAPACQPDYRPGRLASGSSFSAAFVCVVALPDRSQGRTEGTRWPRRHARQPSDRRET